MERVYIPVCTGYKVWNVLQIDVKTLHRAGHDVFINGQSYPFDCIFSEYAAARAYIEKEYGTANKYRCFA